MRTLTRRGEKEFAGREAKSTNPENLAVVAYKCSTACLRNWNIPHATTPYIIHTRSNHHHMFVRSLVVLLPHYLDFYGLETFSPDNSSSDYYPNLIFNNNINNDKIKC
ncbi:hypothetical protein AVEN_186122-1 [Araneus ventricosus]|uniref:Uncharacterized protein n=1 Tax=Araneus ventricosus TaxID=182803 RepID=A0A4Y2HDF7_ARAVE|nr:hypothetical protein AVEN_186122-1 [Araneus ventricosus]